MIKRAIIVSLLLLLSFWVQATHNRAGEISFRNVVGLTYEITVTTYTKYGSGIANKCFLEVQWGDNTSDSLKRVNGPFVNGCNDGEQISSNIYKNIYVAAHTYPSTGVYRVSMADPNRNGQIINIPNSIDVSFYVESIIVIDPFLETNNGPILLNPPIDDACAGQVFYHNPGAYDPDGDSLSYSLIACKEGDVNGNGRDIPGYSFPSASNFITINPVTGDLVWDSPELLGEYNIAIAIEEWRDGEKIGRVIRDMQIDVKNCSNRPPFIDPIPDVCVKAGDTVRVAITGSDPDSNPVTLSATGGPFELVNAATFPQEASGIGTVTADFVWAPSCNEIQFRDYQVSVKITDSNTGVPLVFYRTFNIKVLGPEVTDVSALAIGNTIQVNWSKPSCSNYTALKLYRKSQKTVYFPDSCEIGMPASLGFEEIARIPKSLGDTIFMDDNNGQGIQPGNNFCYRLVAIYPDQSVIEGVEGCLSEESCAFIKKYLPVMTQVSITNTDLVTGTIDIEWSRPDSIDTLLYPGPYEYIVFEYDNAGTKLEIAKTSNLDDTVRTGITRNTVDAPWSYEVDFYNRTPGNVVYLGTSTSASSVFVSPIGLNEAVFLSWSESVPWNNNLYTIYRYNPESGLFEIIGQTDKQNYKDIGLINGDSYCYKIESVGDYSAPEYKTPLLNWSQEVCAIAIDTIPPCSPNLTLDNQCDDGRIIFTWNSLYNEDCDDDIASFDLYYSEDGIQEYQILVTFGKQDTSFDYLNSISVAGCYFMTVTDTNGNTSQGGNVVCVDNCPIFEMPNVFSPNGDDRNDLLTPIQSRYIGDIDVKIYGRWGNLVFATSDPEINWNGFEQSSNKPCTEGVYYYVCTIFEQRIEGQQEVVVSGFVHLFR
ncbi:MAG: gliding motility-associated-like protein [Flavobacteriales bacterium]|jgi:gliding motility-associated-like protein